MMSSRPVALLVQFKQMLMGGALGARQRNPAYHDMSSLLEMQVVLFEHLLTRIACAGKCSTARWRPSAGQALQGRPARTPALRACCQVRLLTLCPCQISDRACVSDGVSTLLPRAGCMIV